MFNILGKVFNLNEREIKKLLPIVSEINALEGKVSKYKERDFVKKTEELRERVLDVESLDLLLPEAFAMVREAAKRVLGERHFDVQLMVAVVLHQGKVAEQKTGEGKTLSATPALYLNALTGGGVHLVTVNDYLARRDCGWMGPIFHLLGLTTTCIINDASFIYDPDFTDESASDFRLLHLRTISRKEAYEADITYGINSEFGFDYLRDNMAQDLSQVVQRDFHFAIVDEVDSVLIDEARTPHIISAPDVEPTQKYYEYAQIVEKLTSQVDYQIDEKLRTVHLTERGIAKIEKLFGMPDIYEKDFTTVHHLEAALKARTLFQKDRDYVVKDGEVIIVDEFTGRLMPGRRFSEGIHQALEAKEKVTIQRESKTLATISLQNYFRMYEKLSGMTGTAVTESEEFKKIYNLDVVVIPTHKPMVRIDLADVVYKTTRAKLSGVVSEIEKAHKNGQPVLVGTTSIGKNEIIGEFLKRRGIPFNLLNAKNHEREAEIITSAGEKGAVTVATNMAGRGVDIILGGKAPSRYEIEEEGKRPDSEGQIDAWKKRHDEVVALGGLFVLGTERHEARRIDNQLRGRSGRQGDPGTSRFFVSLEDEIMRLFGGETIAGLMTRFNMPEDVPLEHAMVSKAIEQAQVKVEGFNFDIRKHLVEYDDVLNKQREIIYKLRRKVLEGGEDLKEETLKRIENEISQVVLLHGSDLEETQVKEKIIGEFITIIPFDENSSQQLVKQLEQRVEVSDKTEFLVALASDLYKKREEQLGADIMRQIERWVSLTVIDSLWMEHLDTIEDLRQGIGLRGYGQRDPLVEYKKEAFTMFERLVASIDDEIVHRIYKIQVQQAPPMVTPSQIAINMPAAVEKKSREAGSRPAGKLGRNDPCPCGSGKKWKKCHYPNIP